MIKNLLLIFALIFSFSFVAPSQASAKKDKVIEVKIGSYLTPQSVWGKAVQKTVGRLKKRTDGKVTIKHMHSGMLGSNKSMLEQVMLGGINGAGVDTSTLATIVPEMNILEMPFLFESREEAYYLMDNFISPYLHEKLSEKGLITSAIVEVGFMDFVMSGPIHKPADLKTKKIGCWESPVHIEFWKAVGGNPLPIPATEVMSSYMRGYVDSGANSPFAILAWDKLFGNALKRNEIYITKTAFTYHAGIIVMNKNFYNKNIPDDLRKIFNEELNNMTIALRKQISESEPTAWKELENLGYNIVEMSPDKKAEFIRLSDKVYKNMRNDIGGDFLDMVLAERAKFRAKKTIK